MTIPQSLDPQALMSQLMGMEDCHIESLSVDIFAHTIRLELKCSHTEPADHPSRYTVVFEGVTAFSYINGVSEHYDEPPWDWAELEDIGWWQQGEQGEVKVTVSNVLHPEYTSYPRQFYANFEFHPFSGLFCISAKSIVINGKRFETGYLRAQSSG